MPSKTSVPEGQKRSTIEINVIALGQLAREQLKKEKARVSSTTEKNNNSGLTSNGTRTAAFKRIVMNILLADITTADVALILPMDHLLLHEHQDGKAGTVDCANRYNG